MLPSSVVLPGERLRASSDVAAGPGTFVSPVDGWVVASRAGVATLGPPPPPGSADPRPVASVTRGGGGAPPAPLPEPGSVVLARVARVTPRGATLDVLVVSGAAAAQPFSGVVRQQDVRATETDKVVLGDCFRAGDVVRCAVLSLGDARAYHLTTARPELGVVHATSAAGRPLAPLDWQRMQCGDTGEVELRKVARTT